MIAVPPHSAVLSFPLFHKDGFELHHVACNEHILKHLSRTGRPVKANALRPFHYAVVLATTRDAFDAATERCEQ